jgi:hypothetical protein
MIGLSDALKTGNSGLPEIDIRPTVDPSSIFLEAELDSFSSPIFDQF